MSEASGNALRRDLCYKCMLRGSEEHWALAQYGLAQTRAEHSPLLSQIERQAHRPARAARHVRTVVSCDSERTGTRVHAEHSEHGRCTEAAQMRSERTIGIFHEVLIATVFCDFSARGAPVPKDQELTARSRVRLDTSLVSCVSTRLANRGSRQLLLMSSPRLTRQLAQCPGTLRRP